MRYLLLVGIVGLGFTVLRSQNALAAAEALAAKQEYAASIMLLESYIDEHPARRYDLGRAYWLLSYNHLREGQLNAARTANSQSARIRRELRSGDLAGNYLRTAQIELAAKQPQAALAAAEQGLQMLVEDTELYVLLHLVAAQAHAAMGAYDWVEVYLETTASILAVELSPDSPAAIEAYYTSAALALQRDQYAVARHWYLQALRYDGDLERLHQLFVQVYPLPE
jgi:hypothetical protein